MSNVLVVFQSNTEPIEQMALAVAVGAVEAGGSIRLRRLAPPGAPEVGHQAYGKIKADDLEWADTIVVGLERAKPLPDELDPLLNLLQVGDFTEEARVDIRDERVNRPDGGAGSGGDGTLQGGACDGVARRAEWQRGGYEGVGAFVGGDHRVGALRHDRWACGPVCAIGRWHEAASALGMSASLALFLGGRPGNVPSSGECLCLMIVASYSKIESYLDVEISYVVGVEQWASKRSS